MRTIETGVIGKHLQKAGGAGFKSHAGQPDCIDGSGSLQLLLLPIFARLCLSREAARNAPQCARDRLLISVESEVRRIGELLVATVLQFQPKAAMVEGEFTLAFYVVTALSARGVPCYAATTRRVATEGRSGDAVVRSSVFEFVRFRRYAV